MVYVSKEISGKSPLQLDLSPRERMLVRELMERNGWVQKKVLAELVQWWLAQHPMVQRFVTRQLPPDYDPVAITQLILDRCQLAGSQGIGGTEAAAEDEAAAARDAQAPVRKRRLRKQ